MRDTVATILISLLVLSSCSGQGGNAVPRTADIEPCELLTDAELMEVVGRAPSAEESEPAGPFTGCSWGTGDVLVSIAPSDSVILAPGEDECPSANLGEESYACPQRVLFLTNGIHVTVSTISPLVPDDQLLALAEKVLSKLQD